MTFFNFFQESKIFIGEQLVSLLEKLILVLEMLYFLMLMVCCFMRTDLKHNVHFFNYKNKQLFLKLSATISTLKWRTSFDNQQMKRSQKNKEGVILKMQQYQDNWEEVLEVMNDIQQRDRIEMHLQSKEGKLTPELCQRIFIQFSEYQLNFEAISKRIGISPYQIKHHILSGLANNIAKVCMIVRKRKISTLQSNFIQNYEIKKLVVQMLKGTQFMRVKQEYSVLWNFISKHHPNDFYHTVPSEQYKAIYRELIILAESFKLNYRDKAVVNIHSFEKEALSEGSNESSSAKKKGKSELNSIKVKKMEQETINLISDSQESQPLEQKENEQQFQAGEGADKTVQDLTNEEIQLQKIRIMKLTIQNRFKLAQIEERLALQPENKELDFRRVEVAIKIACLKLM